MGLRRCSSCCGRTAPARSNLAVSCCTLARSPPIAPPACWRTELCIPAREAWGDSFLSELHHLQGCTSVGAIGVAERFAHFHVRVVRRLDKPYRLALRLHRRGKLARPALEVGRVA